MPGPRRGVGCWAGRAAIVSDDLTRLERTLLAAEAQIEAHLHHPGAGTALQPHRLRDGLEQIGQRLRRDVLARVVVKIRPCLREQVDVVARDQVGVAAGDRGDTCCKFGFCFLLRIVQSNTSTWKTGHAGTARRTDLHCCS